MPKWFLWCDSLNNITPSCLFLLLLSDEIILAGFQDYIRTIFAHMKHKTQVLYRLNSEWCWASPYWFAWLWECQLSSLDFRGDVASESIDTRYLLRRRVHQRICNFREEKKTHEWYVPFSKLLGETYELRDTNLSLCQFWPDCDIRIHIFGRTWEILTKSDDFASRIAHVFFAIGFGARASYANTLLVGCIHTPYTRMAPKHTSCTLSTNTCTYQPCAQAHALTMHTTHMTPYTLIMPYMRAPRSYTHITPYAWTLSSTRTRHIMYTNVQLCVYVEVVHIYLRVQSTDSRNVALWLKSPWICFKKKYSLCLWRSNQVGIGTFDWSLPPRLAWFLTKTIFCVEKCTQPTLGLEKNRFSGVFFFFFLNCKSLDDNQKLVLHKLLFPGTSVWISQLL